MHTLTLTLTGGINDTVTVSLDDATAFTRFIAGKELLTADGAQTKRRGRRATAPARTDGTTDAETTTSAASDD